MSALVLAPGETLVYEDARALWAARRHDRIIGCNGTLSDPRLLAMHTHVVISDWQCVREYWNDWIKPGLDHGIAFYTVSVDVKKMYEFFTLLPTVKPPEDGGLNPDRTPVWHFGSSGHGAIGLAWYLGERVIDLLGFTCTHLHVHGDHRGLCENRSKNPTVPGKWRGAHSRIAASAPKVGAIITDYTRNPSGSYPHAEIPRCSHC